MGIIDQMMGTSSRDEEFYEIIKEYTDQHNGHISGAKNIYEVCDGKYSCEEIKDICRNLQLSKPDFKYEEISYHGQSVVQNINIAIRYDSNLNRMN